MSMTMDSLVFLHITKLNNSHDLHNFYWATNNVLQRTSGQNRIPITTETIAASSRRRHQNDGC